ncbi:type II restriction endonuclease [Streptococcus pneumoniae]|nr:type II restriction endonuclease [Streptococcus pneumoniae]
MPVEIKTTKEIHPKIYAYTTPTVTSNEGWIKIGYTERDVTQRIKEQTHTAHIATDVLWTGDVISLEKDRTILCDKSKKKQLLRH